MFQVINVRGKQITNNEIKSRFFIQKIIVCLFTKRIILFETTYIYKTIVNKTTLIWFQPNV